MPPLAGVVVIGGISRIGAGHRQAGAGMAALYVLGCLFVLGVNFHHIPDAFAAILNGAFTGAGVVGGIVGALIQGFRRAAFSNEAGLGSAAIAHSAVKTRDPVTEGFVALLGTVHRHRRDLHHDRAGDHHLRPASVDAGTGLSARRWLIATARMGVALTSAAFGTGVSWFPYVLTLAVILFAFSTIISWSYYGLKAWTYMFGEGYAKELVFKLMFCVFVVIGAAANLGPVIDFSDAAIFAMAVVNIAALYVLMPIVKRELHSYLSRLKTGDIKKFKH